MDAVFRDSEPFQIGILVPDVGAAVRHYTDVLGIGPWVRYLYSADTIPEFVRDGARVPYALDIALTGQSPQIELLQVRGEPNPFQDWIETRGYGLHHVGVQVQSIAEVIGGESTYPLIHHGRGYGLDGDGGFAYFDTLEDLGIIVEAIEVPARRRPPDSVWPE